MIDTRLVLLYVIAPAALAAAMTLGGASAAALYAAAACAAVSLFVLPPAVTFALFLAVAYLQFLQWEVSGVTVKAEHVAAVMLFLVVALRPARGGAKRETVPAPYAPVAAYLGMNLFSSAAVSAAPLFCLRQFLLIFVVTVAYFLTAEFIRQRGGLGRYLGFFLALGAVESLYGALSLAFFKAGVKAAWVLSAMHGEFYIKGTMREGNIFGGLAAAQGLILLSIALSGWVPGRWRKWAWAGAAVHVIALIISYTRTAWVAFFAGLIILLYYMRGGRIEERLRLYWKAVAAVALAALVFSAALSLTGTLKPAVYVQRFQSIVSPGETPGFHYRMKTYRTALELWKLHPVAGSGTGSYKTLTDTHVGFEQRGGWVSNQFILTLLDTGAAGTAVLAWLLWATFAPFVRLPRGAKRGETLPFLPGLFSAMACLWLCFQTTTGTWLAYFWIHFGFYTAAMESARRGDEGSDGSGRRNAAVPAVRA
ncbi:MAG: O-antigen ligase family protein [bacterium]